MVDVPDLPGAVSVNGSQLIDKKVTFRVGVCSANTDGLSLALENASRSCSALESPKAGPVVLQSITFGGEKTVDVGYAGIRFRQKVTIYESFDEALDLWTQP